LNNRAYSGGIKVINSTDPLNTSTHEFIAGKLNFDNSNTAGYFAVRGVIDTTGIDVTAGATVSYVGSVTTNRELQYNETIHLDVNALTTGSVYPFGLAGNPVNNLDDALILANEYGCDTIILDGTLTVLAGQDISRFTIDTHRRDSDTIVIVNSGATTQGTYFKNVVVSGVMNGAVRYNTCALGQIENFDGGAKNCIITNDITVTGLAANYFIECWTFDIGGPSATISIGDSLFNMMQCRGSYLITDKTGPSVLVADFSNGFVTVDVSCVAGVIAVGGMTRLVDESSVGCYVIDATITERGITDKVWDEQTSEHTISGSTGEAVAAGGDGAAQVWTEEEKQAALASDKETQHTLNVHTEMLKNKPNNC
jgi:hypothetical protein